MLPTSGLPREKSCFVMQEPTASQFATEGTGYVRLTENTAYPTC